MKNEGCLISETANVNGEIERKIPMSRPQNAKFWRFSGPTVRGLKKFQFLLQNKTHIYRVAQESKLYILVDMSTN